jgi:3',5'-cyclic AMP phosphodiesterase CpdA
MAKTIDRRQFLKLAGLGSVGVVLGSALPGVVQAHGDDEFYFLQLSDTHWGFEGAPNPDAKGTLRKAVASINSLEAQPDFVIFTGDLTHTTDSPVERRRRLGEFKGIVGELRARPLRFMPGEHDASLDNGAAFQEFFGATHYTFDHKGVHFIVLDNVSDPRARIGEEQLAWLAADLARQPAEAPIVLFTHRPLFDLAPQWDWATRDGAQAVDLLMPHKNVTVFYGHIHQEHHHSTGHITHHAAKGLMFALPAPGSQPNRTPVPWDPTHPYQGLGFRGVEADVDEARYAITEFPVVRG